jgi:hypothetical protein
MSTPLPEFIQGLEVVSPLGPNKVLNEWYDESVSAVFLDVLEELRELQVFLKCRKLETYKLLAHTEELGAGVANGLNDLLTERSDFRANLGRGRSRYRLKRLSRDQLGLWRLGARFTRGEVFI